MSASRLIALALVAACAPVNAGAPRGVREAEQLNRFPLGTIFQDCESPAHQDRPFPESLNMLAPLLGRGVCVPQDVPLANGTRVASRWGVWTYEYVRAEPNPSPKYPTALSFGPIEATSLGIEAQGEFAHDVPAGLWHFWHPNGKLRAEGSFNEGKLSGEWGSSGRRTGSLTEI